MSEIEEVIEQIFELSAPALMVVLLVLLGWTIKGSPVPNWLIPWILVLVGTFVFPQICDRQAIVYNAYNPTVYTHVIGAILGFAAGGFYEWILKRILDRFKPPNPNTSIPDSAQK